MPIKRRAKELREKELTRLEEAIEVIDSPMGSGKTTYMLDYVKKHPEQRYLIITPYLAEVGRWDEAIPHLKKPTDTEMTKTKSLEILLEKGTSIITTHSLFDRIGSTHLKHISNYDYTLIIDETIPVIEPQDHLHEHDVNLAVKGGAIKIVEGEYGSRLEWVDDGYEGDMLKKHKKIITGKEVIIGPTGYFWCLSRWKLLVFRQVFILTYMFEASYMAAYLRMCFINIPYEIKSLKNTDNGITITDYHDPKGRDYRGLIEIVDKGVDYNRIKSLNDISLTKTSYDKKITADEFKEIKKATRGFFNKYKKESAKKDYMFTTFKDHQEKVTHPDFNHKKINNNDGEKFNECFVPLNARALNKYAHKKYLAYLVDRHPKPNIHAFLAVHGGKLNKNDFALSELLQWIFRSAVRKGDPIKLFIPKKRMRGLLREWLD